MPDASRIINAACTIAVLAAASSLVAADAPAPSDEQREQRRVKLLEQMRSLARATNVRFQQGERQPQLIDAPVLRYDDQPRYFLDATMWVWTDGGRPVAFQKIEAMARGRPQWGCCFTSVADGLLAVEWSDGRAYRTTTPGVEFVPLVDPPEVPARSGARKLEARKLVRDFSASIHGEANSPEQMRLLPTPILEYAHPDSKEYLGAVFAFTTNGTNPALLVMLEPRSSEGAPTWHYAAARMTNNAVTLQYRGKPVWQVELSPPPWTDLPTWTLFATSRTDDEADAAQ